MKEFFNKISSLFEKDIADEFRERITNPFFIALFFSWFAWNWELLFMIFNFDSSTSLWEKISCIKEYVNADINKFRLLWNPIGYSLCAIVLFSLLKQVSLFINLVIINWIQPFIYKNVGSSSIVQKDRFENVTKKVTRLRDAYEKMVDEANDMSEENQALRLNMSKIKEKEEEYLDNIEELKEKLDLSNKNSLDQMFEGKWLNQYIFPNGKTGEAIVEIKDGTKYFEKSKYVFNIDMIEVNKEAGTIKFRKVGLGKDRRKAVNDLKIVSDFEYRGIEDNNTAITYTRISPQSSILVFSPYYSKSSIVIGEKTNINFRFKNNSNTGLEILSYQFSSYFNGVKFATNEKHDYKYIIPGMIENEVPFGEVNPLEYYFNNNKEIGVYDSEITIEYRIDETTEILTLTRIARLVVSPGIIIRLAKYGSKDKFAIVTEKIKEFVAKNNLEFDINNSNIVGSNLEDDPHYGEQKTLEIHYTINGIEKNITGLEGTRIKIE